MIVDTIRHSNQYFCLGSLFQAAFDFLSETDCENLPEGTLSIQGDRVLAIVSSYQTMRVEKTVLVEGHRRYADIQFVVSGSERLAWLTTRRVAGKSPYNPDKDVWTALVPNEEPSFIRLNPNDFAILFPWDAHAPQLEDQEARRVKKIVMKVALEGGAPGFSDDL